MAVVSPLLMFMICARCTTPDGSGGLISTGPKSFEGFHSLNDSGNMLISENPMNAGNGRLGEAIGEGMVSSLFTRLMSLSNKLLWPHEWLMNFIMIGDWNIGRCTPATTRLAVIPRISMMGLLLKMLWIRLQRALPWYCVITGGTRPEVNRMAWLNSLRRPWSTSAADMQRVGFLSRNSPMSMVSIRPRLVMSSTGRPGRTWSDF